MRHRVQTLRVWRNCIAVLAIALLVVCPVRASGHQSADDRVGRWTFGPPSGAAPADDVDLVFSRDGRSIAVIALGGFGWTVELQAGKHLVSSARPSFGTTGNLYAAKSGNLVALRINAGDPLRILDPAAPEAKCELRFPSGEALWGATAQKRNGRSSYPDKAGAVKPYEPVGALFDLAPDGTMMAVAYPPRVKGIGRSGQPEPDDNAEKAEIAKRTRALTLSEVAICEPATGNLVRRLVPPAAPAPEDTAGFERSTDVFRVDFVAFSPSGQLLAAHVNAGPIIVWNVADGTVRRVLDGRPFDTRIALTPVDRQRRMMSWIGDDRLMTLGPAERTPAGTTRTYVMWNIADGTSANVSWEAVPQRLQADDKESGSRAESSVAVFSADGKWAACRVRHEPVGVDPSGLGGTKRKPAKPRIRHTIEITDLAEGRTIGSVVCSPDDPPTAVKFWPGSDQFAVSTRKGQLLVIPLPRLLELARSGGALMKE